MSSVRLQSMAEKTEDVLYSCEVCGQDGLTDIELRCHMLSSHINGYSKCPFCDLTDTDNDEMTLHVNQVHLDYLSPQDEETLDPFIVTNGFGDHVIVEGPSQFKRKINSNHNRNNIPIITLESDIDDVMNANMLSPNEEKPGQSNNPCSPNRSQLSLNLNQRDLKSRLGHPSRRCHIEEPTIVTCLLCNVKEKSPSKLEEHMNRAHFDLSSPSFPVLAMEEDEVITFSCPLCLRYFESTHNLELHVNITHKDILSPAKSNKSTPSDSEIGTCPVCSRTGFPSFTEVVLHIDTHFSRKPSIDGRIWETNVESDVEKKEKEVQKMREHQEFSVLRAQYGMDNDGNFSQQSISNMQRAVYSGEMSVSDYYERKIELKVAEQNGLDDGRSGTKGLLGPIRVVCESSNNVKNVWLCTSVDHYASTYGDRGWGCGYRNIQMLLSCLQHHTGYFSRLFAAPDQMPSISQIQKLIEKAWKSGFDLQGCEQLGEKLSNTRKWIGATEVTTLLSSFRIKCQLIDFHEPTGADGTHPELYRWCLEYFSKYSDFKPPLYLQHQGHSRTVIGIEEMNKGNNPRLLMFDPSHSPTQMSQLTYTQTAIPAMRLIRKSLSAMKAKQYQIVMVVGLIESEQEYRKSKIIQSMRIPKD